MTILDYAKKEGEKKILMIKLFWFFISERKKITA